jgi:hypothetical protein
MGFKELIQTIETLWKGEEREIIFEQANKIVEIFEKSIQTKGVDLPSEEEFTHGVEILFDALDPVNGGFKGTPKFPFGYLYSLLLSYGKRKAESRAFFITDLSLNKMKNGGIYDHLGGGFSRYSVDEKWIVPHFEKMLYDNAFLIKTYVDASKCLEQGEQYLYTAEEIAQFIIEKLLHPEGGFYAAIDADIEGKEGYFYTWKKEEITSLLTEEEATVFCGFYGVTETGNFEGRNILHCTVDLNAFSKHLNRHAQDVSNLLESAKKKLKQAREKRPQPLRDDKILSSWNGLMIDAFAYLGSILRNQQYLDLAMKSAHFIHQHLWRDGILLRRFREGEVKFSGGIDEYAFLIKGLISLFEEGLGTQWLKFAMELAAKLKLSFKAEGGAFYTTEEWNHLIFRNCEFYDRAQPSGNAVHAENLIRLYKITQNIEFLSQAEDILKAVKDPIRQFPQAHIYHLCALHHYYDKKGATLFIILDKAASLKEKLDALFARHYMHNTVRVWKREGDQMLEEILPNIRDKVLIDGQTTVYCCFQNRCGPPMLRLEEIEQAIINL